MASYIIESTDLYDTLKNGVFLEVVKRNLDWGKILDYYENSRFDTNFDNTVLTKALNKMAKENEKVDASK